MSGDRLAGIRAMKENPLLARQQLDEKLEAVLCLHSVHLTVS